VPDADADAATEDARTLRLLRARDERAFAGLLDRYHGPLLRLARSFVSSHAVAEEVVQETWVGVLDGLDSFEERSSLKTWIFRILMNRARTRGEREGRMVPLSSMTDAAGEPEAAVDPSRFDARGMWATPPRPWETATAEALAGHRQALRHLEVALEALPAAQRLAVTLRDIDGLEAAEACVVLGISEVNLRVLLHRGRSRLRASLEAFVDRS
jgi:RNA polymerase sigma-70 factor (ECF subfamily)